ncbi:alpha-ketoglutarate dependent xanthine dioxygenase-2 [Coleophoma cylindrospora]|uniref:Alpha-ketoglutarate dependent xanthine dioxygenase-2 n=1 Tax=Coleophoma cylindrospora TaxID=1849047 RepID=A0A3D8QKG3_9HELO|nr:alpha-ketoglutarate dependent xanthine dioxygenase-2 [Coleophoma cylindrospora]
MPSAVREIQVEPMVHGPKSNVNFGATVRGIDLNKLTDSDFEIIHKALHQHKLLVFKEQPEMLHPEHQYELTRRFDPDETTGGFAHGTDPYLTSHNGVDIYGLPNRPAIPVQPQVHILGRGPVPDDHYQFPPGFKIKGIDHHYFHLPPHIPVEEREAGKSRFYQWHFDGSLYKIPPPRVGCLLAVRTPKGPDVKVQWDDGTGTEMAIGPGSTAMVAGSRALELLSPEMRALAYHSRIEYAPHCFEWMSTAHSTRLGHTIETEGLEKPLDKLKPWSPEHICTYPMVWENPVTGEHSLQVHGQGAFKLYLKSSADGPEKIVTDLAEVRAFLHNMMRPVLEPSNIYAHRHEEQDVILWYNRALWHSITEFPESYGPRIMHQCNIAASDHPAAAPVPADLS